MGLSDKERFEIAAELAWRKFDALFFGPGDGGDLCFVTVDGGIINTLVPWPDDDDVPELVSDNITKLAWHTWDVTGERHYTARAAQRYQEYLRTWLETAHLQPRFFERDGLKYEVVSETSVCVEGATPEVVAADIPNTIESNGAVFTVSQVGDSAFAGCERLKSVRIPDSVTTIGERALARCSSLESVELPDNGVEVHNNAFEDCTSLESFVIPRSVKRIGPHVFDGCDRLISITIPGLDKKAAQWRSRLAAKSIYPGMCPGWVELVVRYLDVGEMVPITDAFLKTALPPLLVDMVQHSDADHCENTPGILRVLAETDQVDALIRVSEWCVFTKKTLGEALEAAHEAGAERAIAYLRGIEDVDSVADDVAARCNDDASVVGDLALKPGDAVVFTGMVDPFDEQGRRDLVDQGAEHGLRVTSAVSGKTALLVADDLGSSSRKARRARELGIRIVDYPTYLNMLRALRT